MRRPNAAHEVGDHRLELAPCPRPGSTWRRTACPTASPSAPLVASTAALPAIARLRGPAQHRAVEGEAPRRRRRSAGRRRGDRSRGRSGSPSRCRATPRDERRDAGDGARAARRRTSRLRSRPAAVEATRPSRGPAPSSSKSARASDCSPWRRRPIPRGSSAPRRSCARARGSRRGLGAAPAMRERRARARCAPVLARIVAMRRRRRRGSSRGRACPSPPWSRYGDVVGRVVEVLRDPEAEEVLGVEVGVVQRRRRRRGASSPSTAASARLSAMAAMVSSSGWTGAMPARLDCRRVHEARVVVADLAHRRSRPARSPRQPPGSGRPSGGSCSSSRIEPRRSELRSGGISVFLSQVPLA